jgi:hypothetical protein
VRDEYFWYPQTWRVYLKGVDLGRLDGFHVPSALRKSYLEMTITQRDTLEDQAGGSLSIPGKAMGRALVIRS